MLKENSKKKGFIKNKEESCPNSLKCSDILWIGKDSDKITETPDELVPDALKFRNKFRFRFFSSLRNLKKSYSVEDVPELSKPSIPLVVFSLSKFTGKNYFNKLWDFLRRAGEPFYLFVVEKSFQYNWIKRLKIPPERYCILEKPFRLDHIQASIRHLLALWNQNNAFYKEKMKINNSLKKKSFSRHLADPVTSLPTLDYVLTHLDQEFSRCNRHNFPLSCIKLGIYDFDAISELYNTEIKNQVLTEVSEVLFRNMRKYDIVSKVEKDEFLFIVSHVKEMNAIKMAERLRKEIESIPFFASVGMFNISICVGISTLLSENYREGRALVKRADEALRQAKNAGKSQVVYLPPSFGFL